jgi:hypothetical protein
MRIGGIPGTMKVIGSGGGYTLGAGGTIGVAVSCEQPRSVPRANTVAAMRSRCGFIMIPEGFREGSGRCGLGLANPLHI